MAHCSTLVATLIFGRKSRSRDDQRHALAGPFRRRPSHTGVRQWASLSPDRLLECSRRFSVSSGSTLQSLSCVEAAALELSTASNIFHLLAFAFRHGFVFTDICTSTGSPSPKKSLSAAAAVGTGMSGAPHVPELATPHQRPPDRLEACARRRLTRLLARDGRKRENCILLDLSYAGLRSRGLRPIGVGETLELLVVLGPPVNRSGLLQGCVRWVHPRDINECDCGLEFSELSKGSILGPDEK